jgi:tRNA modification GTPase
MDTIIAPITPLTTSSVIVIRISGPDSLGALSFIEGCRKVIPRRVYYGNFIIDHKNKLYDSVLYYYFRAPYSYTGEDVLEISFHGNPTIVKKAISSMIKFGFRQAEPGEFTKRAFLNGKIDLTQAEGVLNLINAKNDIAINNSFQQLQGGLKNRILQMKNILVDILSDIEANIDFSEEDDLSIDFGKCNGKINEIKSVLVNILDDYEKNRNYIKNNVNVVIVGKPNVGKSTLFNYILGEERAIVSEIPGTTRDYIEKNIYIGNINFNLIDTAGIREDASYLERYGISSTYKLLEKADLILFIMDLSEKYDNTDKIIFELIQNKNYIIVGNKMDLPNLLNYNVDIQISVRNNCNLDKLKTLILHKLGLTDLSKKMDNIIIQERHALLLNKIYEIFNNIADLDVESHIDIYSSELQRAIRYLSEITGEVYTEEIINNIFNKFCVGK